MNNKRIRIATRKSTLALWQANHVGQLLKQHYPHLTVELVPMQTSGDMFLKDKLQSVGGKGLFVKELEEALLDNRADIAVHSMKDVPAHLPPMLTLAAICKRDNPFDALLTRNKTKLSSLPLRSVIGTSSLRRASQLLAQRADLVIKPLRGNIHTRLEKLKTGQYDAIVLAQAGLDRLSLEHLISETLDCTIMLPACGQGALGIECRKGDDAILNVIEILNDGPSAICIQTEREANGLLGGNCHIPLAVFCHIMQDTLYLQAKIMSADGKQVIQDFQQGFLLQWKEMAKTSVMNLRKNGAEKLLGINE